MKFWQKQHRGLNILCCLDVLRTNPAQTCDFEVRFNGRIFPAHRVVLMASSGYFREVLHNGTQISKQGYIDIEGLHAPSVSNCLQYIYTGAINIFFDNVQWVLQACHFMQIEEIKELCFKFLKVSLTRNKCFDIMSYAAAYQSRCTMDCSVRFIVDNYKKITKTSGYQEVHCDIVVELLRTSQAYTTNVLWKAITRWIEHDLKNRKRELLRLLKEIKNFDLKLTMCKILKHPLVSEDEEAMEYLVTSVVFDQWEDCKHCVNDLLDMNCFLAYHWTVRYNFDMKSELFRSYVFEYLKTHFVKVSRNSQISSLTVADFYALLDSEETKAICQKLRWLAIVNWTDGDQLSNEMHFDKIFSMIDLDDMEPEFIHINVTTYRMVQNSNACKERILDAMFTHAQKEQKINSCLLFNQANGELHRLFNDSWKCIGSDEKLIGGTLIGSDGKAFVWNCPNLYSIKSNGSTEVKPPRPNDQFAQTAVIHRGVVYIFNAESLSHWMFGISDGKWRCDRHGFQIPTDTSACSSDAGVLFLGGGQTGMFAVVYTPNEHSNRAICSMKYQRHNASSASVGKAVFLAGGTIEFSQFSTPIEINCSVTDTWSIFYVQQSIPTSWPMLCCKSGDGIYIASYEIQHSVTENDDGKLRIGEITTGISSFLGTPPQVKEPQITGWVCRETISGNPSESSSASLPVLTDSSALCPRTLCQEPSATIKTRIRRIRRKLQLT